MIRGKSGLCATIISHLFIIFGIWQCNITHTKHTLTLSNYWSWILWPSLCLVSITHPAPSLIYCTYAGDKKAIITTAPPLVIEITHNHKGDCIPRLTTSCLENLTWASWYYIWLSSANYMLTYNTIAIYRAQLFYWKF